MDDVISAMQGGPYFQHQVFDSTVRALKWLFLSFPGDFKYPLSVKELLVGEGDWTCAKEVLGRNLDTEAGTVALSEKKIW